MDLKRFIDGIILSVLFLVVFVYAISGVQWIFNNSVQGYSDVKFLGGISVAPTIHGEQNIVPTNVENTEIEVLAKSAISLETDLYGTDKIIFEKASDKKLPIASLTKLMTAIVVLDNYNLSDTVVVDEIADSQAPMKHDVQLGDIMPVESFLYIMIVGSSNKSAYALSELIGEREFIALMNKKAKGLGMENTFFSDSTGLSSENVSTANDLAKLAGHILKYYPKISEISRTEEFYIPGFGNVVNTNELLAQIPNVVCSKTGFTDEANGCLLLVIKDLQSNNYLINVLLGADDRFVEMKKLINLSKETCQ